ncbi:MAG: hypothetical protein CM1200mP10_07290 [Candidatus Neomarinimicrobiota bacterium]|nr:MAG: hypothetical protein CM1200mP10_07290 [Candidatus Neomarinimicrobiota bacterium]
MPDPYRGKYRSNASDIGLKYANSVQQILDVLHDDKKQVSAFIAEAILGWGGQIFFFPKRGFLLQLVQKYSLPVAYNCR